MSSAISVLRGMSIPSACPAFRTGRSKVSSSVLRLRTAMSRHMPLCFFALPCGARILENLVGGGLVGVPGEAAGIERIEGLERRAAFLGDPDDLAGQFGEHCAILQRPEHVVQLCLNQRVGPKQRAVGELAQRSPRCSASRWRSVRNAEVYLSNLRCVASFRRRAADDDRTPRAEQNIARAVIVGPEIDECADRAWTADDLGKNVFVETVLHRDDVAVFAKVRQ